MKIGLSERPIGIFDSGIGGLTVVRALPQEEQQAKSMLARRTDKDWTLCDAISFAVLDARHVTRAFTFDHHFRQYGRIQVLGLTR